MIASVGDKPSGEAGQLLISRDFGESWAEAEMDTPANSTIWSIGTNPADESLLYACTIFGQIFKSTDGGDSWVSRGLTETQIIALAANPVLSDTLYVGTAFSGVLGRLMDVRSFWALSRFPLPCWLTFMR